MILLIILLQIFISILWVLVVIGLIGVGIWLLICLIDMFAAAVFLVKFWRRKD